MHVDAEVSLLQAASLFQNRRIKFLPIIVPGSATVLALISHVEILEVRAGVGHTRICCVWSWLLMNFGPSRKTSRF